MYTSCVILKLLLFFALLKNRAMDLSTELRWPEVIQVSSSKKNANINANNIHRVFNRIITQDVSCVLEHIMLSINTM